MGLVGFIAWISLVSLTDIQVRAADVTPSNDRASAPLVLTSFLPVHSLTHGVAGGRLRVENWLPAGVDPHDFAFQPRDLRRLRTSGLLVMGGLGLEGWSEKRLREACSNPALQLLESAAGLPESALIRGTAADHPEHGPGGNGTEPGHDHDHDHAGGINPHFWLDPLLAAHAVTNILGALSRLDPAGQPDYARNAAALVDRLHALDREYAQALAPVRGTPFITYHNAFPYLARRYGLRMVGVVESTAAEEPTPREMKRLAEIVRSERVRILFVDGSPNRLARRIAADLSLTLETLETLESGPLTAEAYEAGMRRNLAVLRKSLGQAAGLDAR